MIHAVLSNPTHPEYGQATIPFPIPDEEYDHVVLEALAPLGIGDAIRRDCRVDEFHSEWPILKRLEDTNINLDELDYLAKRLDSFDICTDTGHDGRQRDPPGRCAGDRERTVPGNVPGRIEISIAEQGVAWNMPRLALLWSKLRHCAGKGGANEYQKTCRLQRHVRRAG